MTKNIRSIFEHNIKLLGDMDKAILFFREQQYDKALGIVANSIDCINSVVEAIVSDRIYFNLVSTDSVLEMLSGILEAKRKRDYILLADLLELQLVSFLLGVQELIINKEENLYANNELVGQTTLYDEQNYNENIHLLLMHANGLSEQNIEPINSVKLMEHGYRVEFTSCGLMTLAAEHEGTKFYFHTNSRIQSEAYTLAAHWYRKGIHKYIVYGLGMGYHILELQAIAPEAEIEVYEADPNVIQLACAFSNIKDILLNDRIKLTFDPEFVALKNKVSLLKENELFLIHYPSLKNTKDPEGRKLLEDAVPWSKTVEGC